MLTIHQSMKVFIKLNKEDFKSIKVFIKLNLYFFILYSYQFDILEMKR